MNYGILTTRFTTETYLENIKWREKNNYKGCIYNLKNRISDQNLYDKPYFVLEMNNEINKVMGIGVIKNKISKRKVKIYSNPYFNRYCYEGNKFIKLYDIENNKSLLEKEIYDNFIELFEKIIFYGKGHMKRGQSMTHFPKKKISKLHIELLESILYI
jgi:hypothetical protein|tara:strand:- start:1568 stop:2041 length:474 start_codon:yes stop_codon:yes gene_type:complete